MSDPVRQAVYDRLHQDVDADVEIYHRRAPADAVTPFVIFHRQAGTPVWAMSGTPAFENEVWLVKAVDRSGSASVAEDLALVIDQALNDADLSIPGLVTAYLRRQSRVDYGEQDGAEQYQHVGGLYRLVTTSE